MGRRRASGARPDIRTSLARSAPERAGPERYVPLIGQRQVLPLADLPPVLLLHIPKTAGTSLLLALQNAFGDSRVRRIQQVDTATPEMLAGLIEHELSTISCLAGHLPLHLLADKLD